IHHAARLEVGDDLHERAAPHRRRGQAGGAHEPIVPRDDPEVGVGQHDADLARDDAHRPRGLPLLFDVVASRARRTLRSLTSLTSVSAPSSEAATVECSRLAAVIIFTCFTVFWVAVDISLMAPACSLPARAACSTCARMLSSAVAISRAAVACSAVARLTRVAMRAIS